MANESVEKQNDVTPLSQIDEEAIYKEAFGEDSGGTSGSEKADVTEKTNASTAGDESATGTFGTQGEIQPKEDQGAKGTSGEDYEQKWKTLQGLYNQEKAEKETLKSQLGEMATQIADIKKLQDGTPAQKKEAKEIKAELVKQLTDLYADLSVEDKAALATYDEEFDTVSKSEAKKREIFAKKMAAFVTDAVENGNKALLSQLAPFLLANEQSATENHFKTVKSAHPDFEKYRDDGSLKNWIDTQPAYLKTVLQKVYDSGETEEVIDLYSRFKKENNIVIAGTEDTKVKDDLKKKEEDEIKKKKLQDMEGVDSGGRPIGSAGVGSKDKNDEDSAAAEAFSDK